MTTNPWIDLPTVAPYVLPMDEVAVNRHNMANADAKWLYTDTLPDPYGGDPGASVVLLLSHTGYSEDDASAHLEPEFRNATLKNLVHAPSEWPLYALNPAFAGTPAGQWWGPFMQRIVNRVGLEKAARQVFYAQLSPYHSEEGVPELRSLSYTVELVRAAMARRALIVGLISRTRWEDAVPELKQYRQMIWPKSPRPRRPVLSAGNLGDESFEWIVRQLS